MEPVEELNVWRPEGEGGFMNMEPREVLEMLECSNREARTQGMQLERKAGHRSWA